MPKTILDCGTRCRFHLHISDALMAPDHLLGRQAYYVPGKCV